MKNGTLSSLIHVVQLKKATKLVYRASSTSFEQTCSIRVMLSSTMSTLATCVQSFLVPHASNFPQQRKRHPRELRVAFPTLEKTRHAVYLFRSLTRWFRKALLLSSVKSNQANQQFLSHMRILCSLQASKLLNLISLKRSSTRTFQQMNHYS